MLQVHSLDGTAAGRLRRSISTIRNTSTVAYCNHRRSCAANRTANRRLAFRFSGIVLVAVGILFLTLGITDLQSSAIPCAFNGCPSIFSSYYAPYWDEVYAGLAMTASGIGLLLVSRTSR